MRRLKIVGFGTYLPDNVVYFEDQVRYRTTKENQVDMGAMACLKALENAHLEINQIDLIISASAVMAEPLPATSSLIHERIAKGLSIPAMDINTSCSSFLTALDIASHFIALDTYKTILIVSGDNCSKGINPKQKESYELFSDGAAAVIVTKSEENQGVVDSLQKTYSEGVHLTEIRAGGTILPGYMHTEENHEDYFFDMKGKEILLTTARILPKFLDEFMKKNQITLDDVSLIIPHQASKALKMIMDRMKIPKDKYIDWVSEYGNMVAASIPFVLCKLLEQQKLQKGDNVLLVGTAAGLTMSALLLKL